MQFLSTLQRVFPSVLPSRASHFLLFWGTSHTVSPVSLADSDPSENCEKGGSLQPTSPDPLTLCWELYLIMFSYFVCPPTQWDRCRSYVHSLQQTQRGFWDTTVSKIPDVDVGKTRWGKRETNRQFYAKEMISHSYLFSWWPGWGRCQVILLFFF